MSDTVSEFNTMQADFEQMQAEFKKKQAEFETMQADFELLAIRLATIEKHFEDLDKATKTIRSKSNTRKVPRKKSK